MTDKEKFIDTAWKYLGCNGDYVCNKKLHWGCIVDWCALAVCSIFNDNGQVGKYIAEITGGAGSIPRSSDGKYGNWFKKSVNMPPQRGDLFFLRYNDYPREDKYFCDHVGIVEDFDGTTITTLEGNVDGNNANWAKTSVFRRKWRNFNDWTVYAFYRPNWKAETKSTSTATKKEIEIYQLNSSKVVDYTVKVTATDGLNIRQGAGTNYNKLGAVIGGTILKVTRFTSGGSYKWGLVEYDGIKGWIALDYTSPVAKSIDELALEVIKGLWGNGAERERKLTAAGYDYNAVQKKVNQMYK